MCPEKTNINGNFYAQLWKIIKSSLKKKRLVYVFINNRFGFLFV